jgi:hypothetical protein
MHERVLRAIDLSGGQVLYASGPDRAPFYFGVQTDRDERLGLLVYPTDFRKTRTQNRPLNENRGQVRYGGQESWAQGDHSVAFDFASVDTTLLVGIDLERDVFIGLDPHLWNPLPLGISYYAKDAQLDAMGDEGWSVWEKDNRAGRRRGQRSDSGLEAVVAFRADRFLDFARLERRATDLGLDTSLRLAAALSLREPQSSSSAFTPTHILEEEFDLSSREILELIAGRARLQVAVRGGVAELHLERQLRSDDANIAGIERRDRDGEPDFDVTLVTGDSFRIECKNASPTRYKGGDFRVETQKTRASKNDPASRFYRVDEFDVVAACLFSATGIWQFRFARTESLDRHKDFPDRLAPMQHVDDRWSESLTEAWRRKRAVSS